ncbi:hypothetical protein LDO26_02235 [Luteimonas sp. BDR2-5]|uniref:sensor histidine kinase n=1 Tax=Proluteimonas luteida TaxID=2878685 RepID=UPI001E5296A4|nr:ATP-binding protein [Luteimonas sp. BDR2-5]MCD9027035.1 hypothetical protein [Luteimonas sp. BDR2-5]
MPDLHPPGSSVTAGTLRGWWQAIPVDPAQLRNATMLQAVLAFSGLYQPLSTAQGWWRMGGAIDSLALALAGANTVLLWTWFVLLRRGAFTWAASGFVASSLLLLTVGYLHWGLALQQPQQLLQLVPVLIGGVLLSRPVLWGAVAWLAALVAIGAWQDASQQLFRPLAIPAIATTAISAVVGIVLVAFVIDQALVALRTSLALARKRSNDLARSRDRLQLEMQERERQRDQLVHAQKLEAVGRLASGVAHDFNHLLSLVLGYAARGRSSDDPAQLKAALQGAESAARRATAVSRRLLDFSRQEVTRLESFDPGDAIADMQPMLRQIFPPDIQLVLRLSDAPGLIHFDHAQLELILLGIATNAAQAMPGGGRFTLSVSPRGTDQLEIAASDTGHGMDEATRARCLDPFFTTKPSGQGTGLGLAVASNLVQAAGGSIEVDSTPGQGSTFRIVLPLLARPIGTARQAAAP